MSEKRQKERAGVLKRKRGGTGNVNAAHKLEQRKTKASQNGRRTRTEARRDKIDMPKSIRRVTDKHFISSELEGALQERCKVMPVGKPFLPGNKFGAAGRPPGRGLSKTAKQLAEEIGTQYDAKTGKTKDQHFMEGLYRRACQGAAKAQELWAAYRWNRPLQAQLNVNADLPSDDEALREAEEALREIRAENEHKPTVQ